MANTILITANWHTGALSQQTISRQYDNNRYVVQFVGYPEASEDNELDYYLLVWMSSAPGETPDEIAPIQLASDQWYISNVFTQQTQQIKFQMCALNTAGTFEAHSPIFTGFVRNSLEHDGATQDIDVSTLFDAYREYLNELIIRSGAVVIDPVPTQGSTNAVSSGGVHESLASKIAKPLTSPNGTNGQLLRTLGNGQTEWTDVGAPTDAQVGSAVDEWLDEHPEATTTVQDGAITSVKINSSFLKEIKNGYVTPEMYGAVGNGSTDDHVAINAALNNSEGKCVYFSNKTYAIADSIYLTKNPIINDGVIKYTGNDYAIVLAPPTPSPGESTSIDGAYYKLGKIIALNGNCLKLDSTGAWMQYITFDFMRMTASATGNCVYAKVVGDKWINEIRFLNGRFYGALNAVYIDHSEKGSSLYTSHWTFDKVGFEGVTNGLNIPDKVVRTSFINCRAEEALTNIVLSRATTFLINQTITWSGAIANGLYWKNCSNYVVTFLSGFINERGVTVCTDPIVFKDNMLYGIAYDSGEYGNVANYGAYSYDAETTTQTIDFKQVYDYSTENFYLYNRPLVRRFAIGNNTGAIKTNIYLDDRMFLDDVYHSNNSYLLTLTLSPNVVLTIYDKDGGEVLYTKTGGSSTSYPKLKVTKVKKAYYIENLDISFKVVS